MATTQKELKEAIKEAKEIFIVSRIQRFFRCLCVGLAAGALSFLILFMCNLRALGVWMWIIIFAISIVFAIKTARVNSEEKEDLELAKEALEEFKRNEKKARTASP